MATLTPPAAGTHPPVPLRMSSLLVRTLREDPADADMPSHRLLVRAGYVRRAAAGIFSWLPLGVVVLHNVERIVREEMTAIGAQEVLLPALLPREPYQITNRWTEYGAGIFRLKDRRGGDYLLGPTHEEMFTLIVKDICSTYKDLPLSLFQIQTKYRDEARPRAGLLRGREFVMKDSYSFDLDDAGFAASYAAHREAYVRTFTRLGLPFVIVAAMSGAMGGSASEEFLAPLEVGEDSFVLCPNCGYAANTEALRITPPAAGSEQATLGPAHVEDTPDTPTILSLVEVLNARPELRRPDRDWAASDTLKNILLMLSYPDGHTEALAVGLPGDRELDTKRLDAATEPATVRPFTEADFATLPHLVKGYLGPGALGATRGVRYLLDPRVVDGSAWVTGADAPGRHVIGLVAGRDFRADGTLDVAEVRAGDPCPRCGSGLELRRGIELGHIFQLGRKYSEALGLEVTGADGARLTPTMGSYGLGVTRAIAAIAESSLDERGLCWPREVAPADVHLVAAGRGPEVAAFCEQLTAELAAAGVRVLYDDRAAVSAGVKFADAELLGVPTVVVAGRGLAEGNVEVRDRRSGAVQAVATEAVVAQLAALCSGSGGG